MAFLFRLFLYSFIAFFLAIYLLKMWRSIFIISSTVQVIFLLHVGVVLLQNIRL